MLQLHRFIKLIIATLAVVDVKVILDTFDDILGKELSQTLRVMSEGK